MNPRSVFLFVIVVVVIVILSRGQIAPPALAISQGHPVSHPQAASNNTSVHVVSSSDTVALSGSTPTLTPDFVNRVLTNAGSPASGTGQDLYDLSIQYGVDDAFALATFQHESTYGNYGAGAVNHSLGNIVCAGYPTCNGRFRYYQSWREGFEDFYRLIANEYMARGLATVDAIEPVYAPSVENDTGGYIQTVLKTMRDYRAGLLV